MMFVLHYGIDSETVNIVRVMFDFNDGSARHIVTATFSSNQRVKENNFLKGFGDFDLCCSVSTPVSFSLETWGLQI